MDVHRWVEQARTNDSNTYPTGDLLGVDRLSSTSCNLLSD